MNIIKITAINERYNHKNNNHRYIRRIGLKGRLAPTALALALAMFSTGCITTPKATSLSIGGALAGAAIGAQKGGMTGALVGAAIGGFVGSQIGSYLDSEDQKKLEAVQAGVAASGKSASFVANKSKAVVTVTPEPTVVETVRTFQLASDVESRQLKMIEPREVTASVDTPVFTTLSDKQAPKLTVKKGEKLVVTAHIENDTQWGAIIEQDTVVGYVPLSYLDPRTAKTVAASSAKLAVKPIVKPSTKPAGNSVNTAQAKATPPSASTSSPAVVAALPASTAPATATSIRTVQASGTCRTVTRAVEPVGGAQGFKEQVRYCMEPPPKWKAMQT